jgi:hypothetical protein
MIYLDLSWSRNKNDLEVEAADGYAFIYGSMDRQEFRFAGILDWVREHTKPLD